MTSRSTTIRVSVDQRERLRQLAAEANESLTDTLDAALESLRRERFCTEMAAAERRLQADRDGWTVYVRERDAWLDPDTVS